MGKRGYPLRRTLRIAARTVHIGAAGMLLGLVAAGAPVGAWPAVTALSGLFIVGDDLWRYGLAYLRYAQSWFILVKLALLAAAAVWPALLTVALWVAVVLGSIVSHAPGAVRHHALWGPPGPCNPARTR